MFLPKLLNFVSTWGKAKIKLPKEIRYEYSLGGWKPEIIILKILKKKWIHYLFTTCSHNLHKLAGNFHYCHTHTHTSKGGKKLMSTVSEKQQFHHFLSYFFITISISLTSLWLNFIDFGIHLPFYQVNKTCTHCKCWFCWFCIYLIESQIKIKIKIKILKIEYEIPRALRLQYKKIGKKY